MSKVIITGATGMVGEGVLYECLISDKIDEVLIITRRKSSFSHPKLKEIVHDDFWNMESLAPQLTGYDACFFCLGVSSVGMNKEKYRHITYDLTMHVAGLLSRIQAGMVFCYVSGAGTDSTEKGRLAWARVKGKVENDLQKLPFKAVFNFRPGILEPTPGLENTLSFYKYLSFLFPVMRRLTPNSISTLAELGKAMIRTLDGTTGKPVLEVPDIKAMARS